MCTVLNKYTCSTPASVRSFELRWVRTPSRLTLLLSAYFRISERWLRERGGVRAGECVAVVVVVVVRESRCAWQRCCAACCCSYLVDVV